MLSEQEKWKYDQFVTAEKKYEKDEIKSPNS